MRHLDHAIDQYPPVALVTGGAKRVGAAICERLAMSGFDIAIHYNRSEAEAEALAIRLRALGRRAEVFQRDLAQVDFSDRLMVEVADRMGAVGVLVNNASLFERDEWNSVSDASWESHMNINLRAPFALTRALAQGIAAGRSGLVVNIIDQRVLSLTPHFVSYSLSKAALWANTQQMALALAPHVRVVGIGPGPTVRSERQTPEQYATQCASVPLQRGSSAEEVADAVVAILRMPSFTGNIITLDGGQHLQWASSNVDPSGIVE